MQCRICDSSNLDLAIDLGSQPWGNNFLTKEQVGKELYYPLHVLFCQDCHTAQLDYTVPKETMFGNHTYLSGTTRMLQEHFQRIAEEVDHRFFANQKQKSVLDIGSNDGTQLKCYQKLGYNCVGVESSVYTSKVANDAGVNTLNKFFNEQTARDIGIKFDVINASGVFFHLEELHSVCEGIKLLLKDDGVFVVQFIYAKTMIENGAFDQIYHEHLLYYTLETIQKLLERHGLSMFDAYLAPIHGGSIIGFIKHAPQQPSKLLDSMLRAEQESNCNSFKHWQKFQQRISNLKEINLAKLYHWKDDHKRVYGMGAPVKGNTLLNTFGITTDLIECLVEKNNLRDGLYAPGSHIPVRMESQEDVPDVYFVLSWNFKTEIIKNNMHLIKNGVEFFFPVDI